MREYAHNVGMLLLLLIVLVTCSISASITPTSQDVETTSAPIESSATLRPWASDSPTLAPSPDTFSPTFSTDEPTSLSPTSRSPVSLAPSSFAPSPLPTAKPSSASDKPTPSPSLKPTSHAPSPLPTFSTDTPTTISTGSPTEPQTKSPTTSAPASFAPSRSPSVKRTSRPTFATNAPTIRVTRSPGIFTAKPSVQDTPVPSASPSKGPAIVPTASPLFAAVTPTPFPSSVDTRTSSPRPATELPSVRPTTTIPSLRPTEPPTSQPTVRGQTRTPSKAPVASHADNETFPENGTAAVADCGDTCTGLGVTMGFLLLGTLGLAGILCWKVHAKRKGEDDSIRHAWETGGFTSGASTRYEKLKIMLGAFISRVIPHSGSPKADTPQKVKAGAPDISRSDPLALVDPASSSGVPQAQTPLHEMSEHPYSALALRSAGLAADQSFQLRNEQSRVQRLEHQIAQIEKDNQALNERTRRLKEEASVLAGLSGDVPY